MRRVHAMSETWTRPSTPGSSSTKAPKSVRLRTTPLTLAADAVAGGELLPGVGLGLAQRQRQPALVDVDLGDDDLDLLAGVEEALGVLDLLGPRHLGDVDQALDALLELDERAVVDHVGDLAGDLLADRVAGLDVRPRVLEALPVAEGDPLLVLVDAQDDDLDLVADLEVLAGVADAAPRDVGHVEQPVDPAEVDEHAVVGDVLDRAGDDRALLEVGRGSRPSGWRSAPRASTLRDSTTLARRRSKLMMRASTSSPT